MDANEFREFGHASIDFIINYLENIRERNVLPTITPFSIVQALPAEIPEKAEHWKNILIDMEKIILPGLAHWQSPHFHAFFPSSSSAGSIIGELLIAGLGVLGFSWVSSKAPSPDSATTTINITPKNISCVLWAEKRRVTSKYMLNNNK